MNQREQYIKDRLDAGITDNNRSRFLCDGCIHTDYRSAPQSLPCFHPSAKIGGVAPTRLEARSEGQPCGLDGLLFSDILDA